MRKFLLDWTSVKRFHGLLLPHFHCHGELCFGIYGRRLLLFLMMARCKNSNPFPNQWLQHVPYIKGSQRRAYIKQFLFFLFSLREIVESVINPKIPIVLRQFSLHQHLPYRRTWNFTYFSTLFTLSAEFTRLMRLYFRKLIRVAFDYQGLILCGAAAEEYRKLCW